MTLDATELLIEKLKVTQGDVQAQAAIMAEFRLSVYPEPERRALREALDAAAVLHWFDSGLLARVLAIPQIEARGRFERLQGLSFVEHYGRPDRGLFNVHEATRLGWRRRLAAQDLGRLRELSDRAAACFAGDQPAAGRIEWVYHLLCADADAGAGALESMNRDWYGGARPEDFAGLARALDELDTTGLVAGRARAWTLLIGAWSRVLRGETAQLAEVAAEALQLARDAADRSAEGDAQALLGSVWEAQGQLAAAQTVYGESLTIGQRLVEEDPGNPVWQRQLAEAYLHVGDVLRAQGQLVAAQAAFGETLAISRRLAEQDPGNAGWQRDLAVTHSRVGDVLQAQGQLAAAQAAFGEYLAISRRLAEQDPGNARWQRELAVAHGHVGDVLQLQGQLAAAQAAFGETLAIFRRLAEQDPGNADWQHSLAVSCINLAWVERCIGRSEIALSLYEESARLFDALVERAPGFAQWAAESATVQSALADYRSSLAGPNQSPPQA